MEHRHGIKDIRDMIPYVLAAGIWGLLSYLGIYRCPLDFAVGVPCPLCGLTRAVLSFLGGDISLSFYYHPLWPVLLISVVLFLLYSLGIIRTPKRAVDTAAIILCVLLLVCYVLRHVQGSPVVRIHFDDSLLHGVLVLFRQVFR